ncbi:TPA: hypothetical protein DDW69_00340 [candidate division CPR2 bacterium]|uniref:Uncharacterized protein n=1 Tax=candidate division CPR2 bacterium GW2011_GWC1_41_48 TaxID=1618344 RepID=A0A0G0YGM1_UNCC2|nr:MAG: hypothetical protein UT47_C0005G0002 [candidate division CPR2 bacterium GW2011_GWC2_39_35]KKR27563.1 MAG: hypothetical protein UT59_C0053G0004 [candidate division CPR2 bacterium GW2011_GWD1_39_7]KKR27826.1 MAG: hypothetical protein UT60_C0035G0002 [candidate division CPR2 bacterium GW2011_GWD2_39_7]KKS08691.1 MAG: hypothetical protein UU65_C0005G0002 [candidate division CPR2 bacterium GW2011_GWC1_41_48]OGB58958.1 MAG: hypothetical protein A2Y27_01460 [candidate division CPR2 bacterium G
MEEQNKIKKGMPLWMSIVLVIVIAGLATGGTWYVMDQKVKKNDDKITALQGQVDKLNDDKEEAVEVTPTPIPTVTNKDSEDIKALDISTVVNKQQSMGEWQKPIYADVNGDGKQEGVYWFVNLGTGKIVDLYIYGYSNGQPKNLYKNEGHLYKGKVTIESVSGKDYVKIDWANLTSVVNSGKSNSDFTVDMHQYLVWHTNSFYEQESL